MSKKTLLCTVLLCLGVLGFSNAGIAGTEKGDYFVSPMIGGHVFEGNEHLEHGPTFGLGLGYQCAKNCGLEAFFNYTKSETDPGDTKVDVYPFRLDGYYNILSNKKIEPYVALGLGVISFNPDNGDTQHNFMANYGVGVKYFLTDKIALRGDVRHLISFDDT
jgi:OOP family OmpA-OmpF porin